MALARVALTVLVLAAAVAAVVWVPLPMRVTAPVVLEYRDAHRVYVTVPGRLLEAVEVGSQVSAGETLARLDDPAVRRDVAQLSSERDRQQLLLANLETRRLQGDGGDIELPAARAALADIEQRLAQVEHDAERLTLTTPVAGTVLPAPNVPREAAAARSLPRWSGTPLDERNRGALLETGSLVCLVGDPNRFEAVLHVSEDDVELVQAGQRVQVALEHLPGQTFAGTVVEIAKLDLSEMPRELAASGDLPSRTDRRGISHPLDTWYQARVHFDEDPPRLVARVHGRAKIDVARRTLAQRGVRFLKQTFGH